MKLSTSLASRVAFVGSGATMMIGAPHHPSSDANHSLRHELATMTAHEDWVFAHSFVVASMALFATGLWLAHRSRTWAESTHRALRLAAVALSIYVVETVFHLASKVDSQALADGDGAPVAFTHMALAAVLYPVSGAAIAFLGWKVFTAYPWGRRPIAALAMIGGVMHGLSVPLTLIFGDTEFTPLFAGAAMILAVFAISVGLVGPGRTSRSVEARFNVVVAAKTSGLPEIPYDTVGGVLR